MPAVPPASLPRRFSLNPEKEGPPRHPSTPPATPPARSRLPPASPRPLHRSLWELRGSSPEQENSGMAGRGGGAAFLFPFPSPPPESPPPPAWKRGCELEKGGTSCREGLFQEKKSERAVLGTDSHVSPYVTYKNCPFLPFLGSRGGGVGGRLRYLCLRRGVKTPLKPHPVKTGFL